MFYLMLQENSTWYLLFFCVLLFHCYLSLTISVYALSILHKYWYCHFGSCWIQSCHDSQRQSLQALQGTSWGPFHFHSSTSLQLLFHRSHSASFTPLRNKSFLGRESSIQQFFHKRHKRGVVKKIIVMRLYFCLIHFLLKLFNCSLLFFFFSFSLKFQHQNQRIWPETTPKCALVE